MTNRIQQFRQRYNESSVVFRASIWFLMVTIIDKGISVLTQPILNRILSVEEVGVFGVYSSWYSIFAILATFNLFCGVLEVNITKEPENKRNVIASLCMLSLLISLGFWFVYLVFRRELSSLVGLKNIYVLFMALGITAEAIISFWSVPKRFEYAYKAYSLVIVGLFFVKSVLSIVGAYFLQGDRVLGRLMGLVLPTTVVAIVLLVFSIFRRIEYKQITKYWKRAVLFNLPLIPHYMSTILLSSSDRVMIERITNDNDAGLYTVSYSFASLALIVFTALNNSYTPTAMKLLKEKNHKKLADITDSIVVISVLFSVFLMLLAPEGLLLMGGDKYLPALDIIPILIAGIFLSSAYCIFSNVEFVYEKNKIMFPITLVGTVVNILLNIIFIPLFGYKAAAYTTFIGYLLIAVVHYVVSRMIVGMEIFNRRRILLSLFFMFGCAGASILLYKISNVVRYTLIAGVILIVCVAFRKKWSSKKQGNGLLAGDPSDN